MKSLLLLIITIPALLHLACLPAAHSFNTGSLLLPGDVSWTYGYGRTPGDILVDTAGFLASSSDSLTTQISKIWSRHSLQYRLGVLDSAPFGAGLDIGVKAEFSYFRMPEVIYDYSFMGPSTHHTTGRNVISGGSPPVVEFSVRSGLRSHVSGKGLYRHNITVGWIIGAWVDNGWYLDYAGGIELSKVTPYFNHRFMISPTEGSLFDFTGSDSDYFTRHDRHFLMRSTIGIALRTGSAWLIFPDRIVPECSLIYPRFARLTPVAFSAQLGAIWTP